MTLLWERVDLDGCALQLPDSKTGAKIVHIGQPAVDVLRRIEPLPGNPWVIPEIKPGANLSDLQPFWQRAPAGPKSVPIHDLRPTCASTAVAAGQDLRMIRKLLDHMQVHTMARYAHLAADPVKLAANKVAQSFAAALTA